MQQSKYFQEAQLVLLNDDPQIGKMNNGRKIEDYIVVHMCLPA
jgi:hypothetical protein